MATVFAAYAWLVPALPLAAFALLTAFGRSLRTTGAWVAILASLGSLALALLIAGERLAGAEDYSQSFNWLAFGTATLSVGIDVTNLTSLMMVVVTVVGFLVNVYSYGYMRDDERMTVFYAYVSLFLASMLGLVLADNLLMLYIFS